MRTSTPRTMPAKLISAALRSAEMFVESELEVLQRSYSPVSNKAETAEISKAAQTLDDIRTAITVLPELDHKPRRKHVNSYQRNRKVDRAYKSWIASLPCSVSECMFTNDPIEVAHVGDRAFSNRCPDRETLPFCRTHHRDDTLGMHGRLGKSFWDHYGLDRDELIAELNRRYEAQSGLNS